MKTVAFVCLKEQSQRLAGKNFLLLDGKPLYRHVLETLSKVHQLSHIYVYSSSPKFANNLPSGTSWMPRDEKLDSDETSGTDLFRSFAELVDSDYYLLAHSTSPFLKSETIEKLFQIFDDPRFDSAFTGEIMSDYFWFDGAPVNFNTTGPLPRTQELSPLARESNGAYLYGRDMILSHGRRVGFQPLIIEQSPEESIDIDTDFDWNLANYWVQTRGV